MTDKGLTVLSLFDGMSCGQIALERCGIKVNKYYASEIKPHAIKVTKHNYPDTIHVGDVTKISYKDGVLHTENGDFECGQIDLLIGGSPCQDFSLANNNRLGLKGKKSSLFYEYLRLKEETKAKFFLLENVEMPTKDMHAITKIMGVTPVNINSELVSAQMRNRFYWTNIPGDGKDLFSDNHIAQPKDRKILLQDIIEDGFADRKKSRCLLYSDSRPLSQQHKMAHRYFNAGFTTIVHRDNETYLRVREATKIGFVDMANNEGVDLSYPTSKTRRGRHMKNKSNCLLRNNEYFLFQDGDIRYFTQTELERLQTVPEGYTSCLSRNQAADVLGDGWTIDVICHLFQGLKSDLK